MVVAVLLIGKLSYVLPKSVVAGTRSANWTDLPMNMLAL